MNAPAAASALAQNVPTTRAVGGVVLDSLTGKPLPGIRLFVQRADTPATWPPAARTDTQGRYRIVAAPTTALVLCAEGPRATRLTVAAGGDSVAPEIRILTYREKNLPDRVLDPAEIEAPVVQ